MIPVFHEEYTGLCIYRTAISRIFRFMAHLICRIRNDEDRAQYAKCYYKEFNYVFYQDSYVYAVYGDNNQNMYDIARQVDNSANLTFLENSRNQWNIYSSEAEASYIAGSTNYADRIFSDFVLTYNYKNKLINSLGDSGVEAGVLIEQVQKLDTDAKGFFITDIAHYSPEYSTTNAEHYLSNQTYTGKFIKDVVTTQLDNKNSLEYYYQFANIKQAKNEIDPDKVPTTNKEYLYRAYTYIKDGTDTVVSKPVYFTIYDIASIANYSESEHYSSN